MRPPRFVLLLALVTVCMTLGLAQDRSPTSRDLAQNGKTETSYDRAKDVTTVRLNSMQVYGEAPASSHYVGSDGASFYASFTYSGRRSSGPPQRVLFTLTSTSEDWKYTDFHRLSALVDGKRFKLGPLEHVPSFTVTAHANSISDDYISEEIAISLPLKTFLRIANGKRVLLKIGPRELKLELHHLEALRDLASQIVP